MVAYNNAVESGATGWDLFGQTLLGIFAGAVIGGAIGAAVGALVGWAGPAVANFLGSSFKFVLPALKFGGEVLIASTTITLTGVQIAAGVGAVALGSYVFFGKKSKLSGKDTASDRPSWVNGDMIDPNLTPQQNATNMLNNKYGKGNWKTGPKTEHNMIKKWIERWLNYYFKNGGKR